MKFVLNYGSILLEEGSFWNIEDESNLNGYLFIGEAFKRGLYFFLSECAIFLLF